jgi:hypothetical protein
VVPSVLDASEAPAWGHASIRDRSACTATRDTIFRLITREYALHEQLKCLRVPQNCVLEHCMRPGKFSGTAEQACAAHAHHTTMHTVRAQLPSALPVAARVLEVVVQKKGFGIRYAWLQRSTHGYRGHETGHHVWSCAHRGCEQTAYRVWMGPWERLGREHMEQLASEGATCEGATREGAKCECHSKPSNHCRLRCRESRGGRCVVSEHIARGAHLGGTSTQEALDGAVLRCWEHQAGANALRVVAARPEQPQPGIQMHVGHHC